MTKNQKIALGCGAAGCLGLIVVAIAAAALIYWRSQQRPVINERGNRNFNTNSNTNQNSNSNENENNDSSGASSNSTASTLSDDDKHKLFQAASMTQDADVMQRVVKKIGLFKADGTPADGYPQFIRDHVSWGLHNADFITSINTTEKARE